VRRADDQLRITAQLIDAIADHHLWAERYDRPLTDIFAVQDEIVHKIVTTLRLQLTLREQGYLVRKPIFWKYEVANGLNKAVARGELSEEEGRDALALLLALPIRNAALPSAQESYELARKYQRSVYDSWYVHLAEMNDCEFWTADRKLYAAPKDAVPWIRWLADYQSQIA